MLGVAERAAYMGTKHEVNFLWKALFFHGVIRPAIGSGVTLFSQAGQLNIGLWAPELTFTVSRYPNP